MPACCGLITMGFGVFKCTVEIVIPPHPGGGGGHVPAGHHGGYHAPMHPHHTNKRLVVVTVRYHSHEWKKYYDVSKNRAKIIVDVINFTNTAREKIMVGVDSVRKTAQRVTAFFTKHQ